MTALRLWQAEHHAGWSDEEEGRPWRTMWGSGAAGCRGRGGCSGAARLPLPHWAAVPLGPEELPPQSSDTLQPLQLQDQLQESVLLSVGLVAPPAGPAGHNNLSISAVWCTAPSLYRVVEAEGSVAAKSCVDLWVPRLDLTWTGTRTSFALRWRKSSLICALSSPRQLKDGFSGLLQSDADIITIAYQVYL